MTERQLQGGALVALFVFTILWFVSAFIGFSDLETIKEYEDQILTAIMWLFTLSLIFIFCGWILWGIWAVNTKN